MINFIKKFFIHLFICCFERDKRKKLKKSGYIVDRPSDYDHNLYSTYQRYPPFGLTVYTKYGRTYSVEEIQYYIKMKNIYPNLKLTDLYY